MFRRINGSMDAEESSMEDQYDALIDFRKTVSHKLGETAFLSDGSIIRPDGSIEVPTIDPYDFEGIEF